jgi:monofunctional biosynthetic peptidoglycan transglycosylase
MRLRIEQARKAKVPYTTKMIWRDLNDISPNLVHAVLVAEDDTFYQHNGFDVNEIKEAIRINWAKKRWAYGGSTITQQLARNLYLSPQKNLLRKLKEALITVRLEQTLPKKRILEIYLNVVEWGRGIYGAEAAAQFYYQKSAADLTADEAAALASILPSPRRWSPHSEKAFMARRRTQLLNRMRQAGYMPDDITASVDPFDPTVPVPDNAPPDLDTLQGNPHEAAPTLSE